MSEPEFQSLNKGGEVAAEQQTKTAKDLIAIEWKIINKLLAMAENTTNESQKAFHYQNLTGHIRTLALMLKLHGQPDNSQDLAKILGEITKEAKTKARRLKRQ